MLADSFAKLSRSGAPALPESRLAVRSSSKVNRPIALFTFLLSNRLPLGQLVRIALSSDGKTHSVENWAAENIMEKPGDVAWSRVELEFAERFARLSALAHELAAHSAAAGVERERDRRRAAVEVMREDLAQYQRDRLSEIDKEESAVKSGASAQLSLFAERDAHGFKAKRAAVDTFFQQRNQELARYENGATPPQIYPLGVAFIFPEIS
jgi:hypothetical protein